MTYPTISPDYYLDVAAVVWFIILIGGYRLVAEWGPLETAASSAPCNANASPG